MLTRLFVRRPTLSMVVIALALLSGLVAWNTLVRQEYPNVAHPTINISATYAGAPTTVMRDAVVIPIEEQVSGSPDLQHLSAVIEAGRASHDQHLCNLCRSADDRDARRGRHPNRRAGERLAGSAAPQRRHRSGSRIPRSTSLQPMPERRRP